MFYGQSTDTVHQQAIWGGGRERGGGGERGEEGQTDGRTDVERAAFTF